MSRASSVSARDRSTQTKRKAAKQRRDDSESFDSRSQYVAWCTPQQQTWVSPQYIPVGNPQFNGQFQQPRPNALQPVYGTNPTYSQVMPNNGYASQFNPIPPVVRSIPVPNAQVAHLLTCRSILHRWYLSPELHPSGIQPRVLLWRHIHHLYKL